MLHTEGIAEKVLLPFLQCNASHCGDNTMRMLRLHNMEGIRASSPLTEGFQEIKSFPVNSKFKIPEPPVEPGQRTVRPVLFSRTHCHSNGCRLD